MNTLDQHFSDKIVSIKSHGCVLFVIWRDAPTMTQMTALGTAGRTLGRSHPGGLALWSAVIGGTPNFREEVRTALVKMASEDTFGRVGNAHIVLTQGFGGAATRAFLSAAMFAGRPKAPTKVFGDVDPASTWMAKLLETTATPLTKQQIQSLHEAAIAAT